MKLEIFERMAKKNNFFYVIGEDFAYVNLKTPVIFFSMDPTNYDFIISKVPIFVSYAKQENTLLMDNYPTRYDRRLSNFHIGEDMKLPRNFRDYREVFTMKAIVFHNVSFENLEMILSKE